VPARRRTFLIETPAAREDEIAGRLWAFGCDGLWSEESAGGTLRIHAFFPDLDEPTAARLLDGLDGAGSVSEEAVPDLDWAAEFRRNARPIELGARFLVDPREPEPAGSTAAAGGRRLLRLPARTAFGVGTHESTRLAVELLEALPVAGRRAVDVGAGTGILAMAALELGAASVVALDVDPAAALLLPQYMTLNRLRFPAYCGTAAALAPNARFDLALVNVVPREIAGDLACLVARLAPGALALFSGILAAEVDAARAPLAALGLVERARRVDGEWLGLAMERPR